MLQMLNKQRRHQHIVELKHFFYRTDHSGDKYLYIVMGFQPFDFARLIRHPCFSSLLRGFHISPHAEAEHCIFNRHYSKTGRTVNIVYTKVCCT